MNGSESLNGSCILEDIVDKDVLTPLLWDFEARKSVSLGLASTIVQLVFFLIGLPLNTYVIFRIVKKRLYSEPTYILLLSLAVTDLLTCLVPIPFHVISGFTGQYSFGSSDYIRCLVCKISATFLMTFCQSLFNLALISLDRFAFFKISMQYEATVTVKKTLIALLVTWLLSIGLVIPPLVGYGDSTFSISCGSVFITTKHIKRSILIILFNLVVQSVAVVILMVSNVWIVCIALKHIKNLRSVVIEMGAVGNIQESTEQRRKISRRIAQKQFKLLKVFGVILLVDFIIIIPSIVLGIAVLSTKQVPGEYS